MTSILNIPLGVNPNNEVVHANIKDFPHLLVAGTTGSGKALDIKTPIPTIHGYIPIGDIKEGDIVFDENGKQCKVTRAFNFQLDRQCYEIEFSDKSTIVADADHQWFTWTAAARNSANRRGKSERKFLKGGPMARTAPRPSTRALPSVVTTEQILETLRTPKYQNRINHSIPVAKALERPEQNLPIDPYLFGYWLGDGTSRMPVITVAKDDLPELLYQLEDCEESYYIKDIKETTSSVRFGQSLSTCRRGHNRAQHTNKYGNCSICARLSKEHKNIRKEIPFTHKLMSERLQDLDVIDNKHIPVIYMNGSIEQRMMLLRGLMDSDGYVNKTGSCEFSSMNKNLAKEVHTLASSLGIKATLNTKKAMYKGKDCGTAYRVVFTTEQQVFELERKVIRQNSKVRPTQSHRYITVVRPVESRAVRCIEVDSPNHLYLAGYECIPTHNSSSLHALVCSLLMKATPDQLQFMMVDSKQIELPIYDGIPHLLCPVVTDAWEAIDNFKALVALMESRYEAAKELNAKTLEELNEKLSPRDQLPYIVVIVDEVADLIMLSKHEIEESATRIAQKARACGIYLILATQSPRREVISGLLKANLASRLGFAVSSGLDSRIIMDCMGCENLIGKGDALFSEQGKAPFRIQTPYISSSEIESIVEHWKSQVYWQQHAA